MLWLKNLIMVRLIIRAKKVNFFVIRETPILLYEKCETAVFP